ncbi:hypothetical protein WAX87_11055 [Photobacterium damselae subsp. damselae]|uniref:hypothetical protein n=1 Tax=Photobacterium damselae TaxID=38293 RepID=UPI00311ACC3C
MMSKNGSKLATAVLLLSVLSGCTSIITYIKSDSSHDNKNCKPSGAGGGGIFNISRDCIIAHDVEQEQKKEVSPTPLNNQSK